MAVGKCHICEKTAEVTLCPHCNHWFCAACRERWFARGWAAVKALIGWPRPNCCGPDRAEVA